MRLWLAFLTLPPMLAACGFNANGKNGNGSAGSDSGVDVGPPPPDAQLCYGSIVRVCFAHDKDIPTVPVNLPSSTSIPINTDTSSLCNKANDQSGNYCVVAGSTLMLPNTQTIRASGSKPLVLLATGTMDIEGMVDVSSNRGLDQSSIGAGANPTACVAGVAAAGGGGGYGGSFGGKGGAGETITGNTNPGAGAGGTAAEALTTFPTMLRGGCAGSIGGGIPVTYGAGGNGGGAVALVASQLTFNGRINASGSGGNGAMMTNPAVGGSGGGGGGSGGMIVLDVDTTKIGGSGLVYANGGGGGGGGDPAHGGDDGLESSDPTDTPKGGPNTGGGRDGGAGGAGTSGTSLNGMPGGGSKNLGGGGGGGGGAGFVHAPGVNAVNVAPPSLNPS